MESPRPERLDFLGQAALPLARAFGGLLADAFAGLGAGGFLFRTPPLGADPAFGELGDPARQERWPELVASPGLEHLFAPRAAGALAQCYTGGRAPMNPDLERAGCADPRGVHAMYAATPYVLLVDRRRLGRDPVPRTWGGLLDPALEGRIIVGGARGIPSTLLLAYLHQAFGRGGLRRLAAGVKEVWHPSRMARRAGALAGEGAAVYVLPWLFARACPRRAETLVVWPEDGAFISPMFLLSRSRLRPGLERVADAVRGTGFGRLAAGMGFASANPRVDNRLPPGARLRWLGWDYVQGRDMEALTSGLREEYLAFKQNPG